MLIFFFSYLLNLKRAVGGLHLMSERTDALQRFWKFHPFSAYCYRCRRLWKHFLMGKTVQEFNRGKEFRILPVQWETTVVRCGVVWCGCNCMCVCSGKKHKTKCLQTCNCDHVKFDYCTFYNRQRVKSVSFCKTPEWFSGSEKVVMGRKSVNINFLPLQLSKHVQIN